MKLHGYFRSSASYRVRIVLNLKGIAVEHLSHHLRKGEQRAPEYLALNPQGFVPSLVLDDGTVLTQSLAIIDYLDRTYPQARVIPEEPVLRAKVLAFANAISCDIHPVQNLAVLNRLRKLGISEDDVTGWARDTNAEGLRACNALIANEPGPFCFGKEPTLADICLVAMLGNAKRFGADLTGCDRLFEAEAACAGIKAFQDALPERQPDAE